MEAKLSSWTHHFLTLPGRLLLTNYVLNAMPLYLFFDMVAYDLILKKKFNLQSDFIWGVTTKEEKWALVGMSIFFLPKRFGGPRLKDPSLMGKFTFSKIWWRWIESPDSLWDRIWYEKYTSSVPLPNRIRMTWYCPGSLIRWNSWINRDLFQHNFFCEIKERRDVVFWNGAWEQEKILGEKES